MGRCREGNRRQGRAEPLVTVRHSGMVRRTGPQGCNCTPGNSAFSGPDAHARPATTAERSCVISSNASRKSARLRGPGRRRRWPCRSSRVRRSESRAARRDRHGPRRRAALALMVSTSVSGMPASFSPKCSCVGTLRLVVGEADDGAAVIADGGRQARQLGRRRIGDAAAEAEADDADRADILHRVDGGLGIAQHRGPIADWRRICARWPLHQANSRW